MKDLPYSQEAELCAAGSLLLSSGSDYFHEIHSKLKPEWFLDQTLGEIVRAVDDLNSRGIKWDAVTVREELAKSGKLDGDGGSASVLAQALNAVPSFVNGSHYAEIVRDKAQLRELIRAGELQGMEAKNASANPTIICEAAIDRLSRIQSCGQITQIPRIDSVLDEVISDLLAESSPLIPSGFSLLDREIGGFAPGEMVVIAGRPSMGKSLLGKNIIRNIAGTGIPCGIITQDEDRKKVIRNMISSEAEVENSKVRGGRLKMDDCEWDKVMKACGRLQDLPIFVQDKAFDLASTIAAMSNLKIKHKVRVVVQDYMQLVNGSDKSNRQNEVAQVSRALKQAAKRLDIALIEIAQVGRDSEKGGPVRSPRMSDLRESGQIEQDCDMILLVHRPGYYQSSDALDSGSSRIISDEAQIIIAKAKDSARNLVVKLRSELRYQKFLDEIPSRPSEIDW